MIYHFFDMKKHHHGIWSKSLAWLGFPFTSYQFSLLLIQRFRLVLNKIHHFHSHYLQRTDQLIHHTIRFNSDTKFTWDGKRDADSNTRHQIEWSKAGSTNFCTKQQSKKYVLKAMKKKTRCKFRQNYNYIEFILWFTSYAFDVYVWLCGCFFL